MQQTKLGTGKIRRKDRQRRRRASLLGGSQQVIADHRATSSPLPRAQKLLTPPCTIPSMNTSVFGEGVRLGGVTEKGFQQRNSGPGRD